MNTRMKTKQLVHCLPDLVNETQTRIKSLIERCGDKPGDRSGVFKPLDEVFRMAYALLLRQFGANEILRDPKLLARSQAWVQTLIASQSVTQIVFPWLGKFLSFKRTVAGIQLFRMIGNIEKNRMKTGVKEDDWLQQLMDGGNNTLAILSVSIPAAILRYPENFPYICADIHEWNLIFLSSLCWEPSSPAPPTPQLRLAMCPHSCSQTKNGTTSCKRRLMA